MHGNTEQGSAYVLYPTFFIESTNSVGDLSSMGHMDPAMERALAASGVRRYCASSMSLVDMCTRAAFDCVSEAGNSASRIDAVLVATASSMNENEEFALANALHALGIRCSSLLSIQWLHCSAFSKTVEIAQMMIRCQEKKNVLVILGGKVQSDADRVVPTLGIVEGDGAAAFVVSRSSTGLRIVATETKTALDVRLSSPAAVDPLRGAKSYGALRSLARGILDRSNMTADEIGAVVCTNGSSIYLELAASAAGLSDEKVLSNPLAQFGHVFSCDSVIGLATYLKERERRDREFLLVLGWSSHITGATLLEWV